MANLAQGVLTAAQDPQLVGFVAGRAADSAKAAIGVLMMVWAAIFALVFTGLVIASVVHGNNSDYKAASPDDFNKLQVNLAISAAVFGVAALALGIGGTVLIVRKVSNIGKQLVSGESGRMFGKAIGAMGVAPGAGGAGGAGAAGAGAGGGKLSRSLAQYFGQQAQKYAPAPSQGAYGQQPVPGGAGAGTAQPQWASQFGQYVSGRAQQYAAQQQQQQQARPPIVYSQLPPQRVPPPPPPPPRPPRPAQQQPQQQPQQYQNLPTMPQSPPPPPPVPPRRPSSSSSDIYQNLPIFSEST